jgi:hypothetical protein
VAVRDGRGLGPAADVELGQDPRHVDARGLLGHVQRGADLAAVRRAGGEQRRDLRDLLARPSATAGYGSPARRCAAA